MTVEDLTPQGDTGTPAAEPAPEAGPPTSEADDSAVENLTPQEGDAPAAEPAKEAEGAQEGDEATEGAPETYGDFELPEGVEVNEEALETFQGLAKELNLTQEAAQKLVTFQAELQQKAGEQFVQAWEETNNKWVETAKADKEIGGTEFDARLATAKKAITQFGTKQLVEALDATGVGNHPEMIRFMYRVGKLLENDKIVLGAPAAQQKSVAQKLYPSMQEK